MLFKFKKENQNQIKRKKRKYLGTNESAAMSYTYAKPMQIKR